MNIWRKIRMWWHLQTIGASQDVLETLKKGIEKVKVEKKEGCSHETLKQLIENDMWYQCKKCKMVFFLSGASGWDVKQIPILTGKLNESLKIKEPKNKE